MWASCVWRANLGEGPCWPSQAPLGDTHPFRIRLLTPCLCLGQDLDTLCLSLPSGCLLGAVPGFLPSPV